MNKRAMIRALLWAALFLLWVNPSHAQRDRERPVGQLCVLRYHHLPSIKPNLTALEQEGEISGAVAQLCWAAEDNSRSMQERLDACRKLDGLDDLRFTVKRWATMMRILLAGSLNLRDELTAQAQAWLSKYPNDEEWLPEDWLAEHPEEFDVNMYLRAYLVHVYRHVVNDAFNWSMAERLARVREVMQPVCQKPALTKGIVDAKVLYGDAIVDLTEKYITEQSRSDMGTEESETFSKAAQQLRIQAKEEQLQQVEEVRQALTGLIENPTVRGVGRGRVEHPEVILEMVDRMARAHQAKLDHETATLESLKRLGPTPDQYADGILQEMMVSSE